MLVVLVLVCISRELIFAIVFICLLLGIALLQSDHPPFLPTTPGPLKLQLKFLLNYVIFVHRIA